MSQQLATTEEWLDLRVLDQIRKLRKDDPPTAEQVMVLLAQRVHQRAELEKRNLQHSNRLEWAWFGFRVFMAVLGFSALVVYAIVSSTFIANGAPAQGSIALGAGAVSVVAIFVTGRAAGTLLAGRTQRSTKHGQRLSSPTGPPA